ncbi:phage tail assembly protein [Pseudonocardia sp.]|uniref:phage tail assembly protein n=1 Tax=Pseudonocardia sp. TaxID=60912 RepID=UPI003D14CA0A
MELNGSVAAAPTEFAFTLPRGLTAPDGTVHRDGTMRLATAFDEIEPLRDPRVRANPGYLVIILLARVITRLGTMEHVSTHAVEHLYAADLAYLQELYQRVNATGSSRLQVDCPHCSGAFEVETAGLGG